jgi:membrane protease YdiL (CAAX protease family)
MTMALSLGDPNLPGMPDYVRQTGRLLLALLLPYYALAIVDGFFLPELVRNTGAFIAYDLLKFIALPGAMLWFLHRRLQLDFNELCLIGRGSAYRGSELAVLTFWWAGFLYVVFLLGEPLVMIPLGLLLALPHALLSLLIDLPQLDLQFAAHFGYNMALPDNAVLHALAALFFSATAGVIEEVLYRGLFRQMVAALFGPAAVKTYIFGSALVFGLAHWEQGSVGLYRATAFGLAAAVLYLKLGDLGPLILAHALIDLYIFW